MTVTSLCVLTKPPLLHKAVAFDAGQDTDLWSTHCLLAGPESIQTLHLCLVHASSQEALLIPFEMQVAYEVTRQGFLYDLREIRL